MHDVKKIAIKFFIILCLSSFLIFISSSYFFYLTINSFFNGNFALNSLFFFDVLLGSMLIIFSVSTSYIFYQLLLAYNEQKSRYGRIFECFLESISHKFGNFLSGLKVNLFLLKDTNTGHECIYLQRLDQSVSNMETELLSVLSRIHELKEKGIENLNSRNTLGMLVRHEVDKALAGSVTPAEIFLRNEDFVIEGLEFNLAISLLLENSICYAREKIYAACGIYGKDTVYFYVSNDVDSQRTRGPGIGLSLVDTLARGLGFVWKARKKNGRFQALLTKKVTGRT